MQNVSCPSCGAPVLFKSHASVMAVCEYCKTTLLKDAQSIKDIGKMSDVLEDYSPIQIGTSGQFGGKEFTVIGRIQLRYPAGMWNEWHIGFNDGHTGWLSDASGQYAVTIEQERNDKVIPPFKEIRAGHKYSIAGTACMASDVRIAECTGGQGELPFKVGQGWQARVADFRNQQGFVTVDYSDPEPRIYAGRSVALEELKPQLLRDDDAVRDAAGKIDKPVERFQCPSCGGNVPFVPGITRQSICPSCHSLLDTTTTVAHAVEAAERMERHSTTLELGARATINGSVHELIGVMTRRDEEGAEWNEYLMYSPRAGLLWLIETDEGWFRSKVQDVWPHWERGDTVKLGQKTFRKLYEYTATVEFAAGAFNWKVSKGDSVRVYEFELGTSRLAAELTQEELTWSLATPVPADQMRAWFGVAIKESPALQPKMPLPQVAKYFLIGLAIFNAIPLLLAFDDTFWPFVLSAAAIYYPAMGLSHLKGDNE